MNATIDRVVVVVPVFQEVQRLGDCLQHLDKAVDSLQQQRGLRAEIALVLDRCTDGSVGLVTAYAAKRPDVAFFICRAGSVGRARAVGVDRALAHHADLSLHRTWISNTDADSTVPPWWLVRQLELADGGADLVTGTVEPFEMGSPECAEGWHQAHRLQEGHPYVHGANLGVRASAYREVGGFRSVPEHEDVLLVEALRRSGHPLVATDTMRVRTSARVDGRTPGGFSGYVRGLDQAEVEGGAVPESTRVGGQL